MKTVSIKLKGPYDLRLSLRAAASYTPEPETYASLLKRPIRINGTPGIVEVRQDTERPTSVEISFTGSASGQRIREAAAWILLADRNLQPFYESVKKDPILAPVVDRLYGLKPFRPNSLFEMAVTAITEQQISLIAAHRIRTRLIERFGEALDSLRLFPEPDTLAQAGLQELCACGLSIRKAEYISGLAGQVAEGSLDMEGVKQLSDEDLYALFEKIRGFGRWSADYCIARGLGRLDVVVADDLGIRTLAGKYLGDGPRMTAEAVRSVLSAYAPFGGIVMFYLSVYNRLFPERRAHGK